MTTINALLSTLEDPISVFSLRTVSQDLAGLVDAASEREMMRAGWWGVSPRCRSVEDEDDIVAMRLLIGSVFVLGQVAITETVSIATRLRSLAAEPSRLPQGRVNLMTTEATIHAATGVSVIVLIDAVANYVKHHSEWPPGWTEAAGAQRRTIDVVLRLGFLPNREDNLGVALQELGMRANDMDQIGRVVQEWRERIAVYFRRQISYHDLERV